MLKDDKAFLKSSSNIMNADIYLTLSKYIYTLPSYKNKTMLTKSAHVGIYFHISTDIKNQVYN